MTFFEFFDSIYLHFKEKKEQHEHNEYMRRLDAEIAKHQRFVNVNQVRREMPCLFKDGITQIDLKILAEEAAKKINRIKNISVYGAIVYCVVESLSTLTDWDFNVDFNNWGHIDGTFWTHSDNKDSSIPKQYGMILSGMIHDFMHQRNLYIEDFSDAVDANTALETATGLNTRYREGLIQSILGHKSHPINMSHDSKYFCGEHIYPIISILKQNGFVNIKSVALEDVDNNSRNYIYEVEKISIGGIFDFEYGYAFPHDIEIVIYYHSKRKIKIASMREIIRRKNYNDIGNYLQDLGFSEIYERPIKDLIIGLITKNGSVENILVKEDEEVPMVQGKAYYYDTKIIIRYHTYK